MPDTASLPDQLMPTGEVNHERVSGARAAVAATSVGAVWSMRIGMVVPAIGPEALDALHVTWVPGVSSVSVLVSQPLEVSSSSSVHFTVTGPTNQPLSPVWPLSA